MKQAHQFDPMKQMGKQEFLRIGENIVVIRLRVFQVSMPETAGILQMLRYVGVETLVKIEDLRIQSRRVIYLANIAFQSIHCLEATNCKFAVVL